MASIDPTIPPFEPSDGPSYLTPTCVGLLLGIVHAWRYCLMELRGLHETVAWNGCIGCLGFSEALEEFEK